MGKCWCNHKWRGEKGEFDGSPRKLVILFFVFLGFNSIACKSKRSVISHSVKVEKGIEQLVLSESATDSIFDDLARLSEKSGLAVSSSGFSEVRGQVRCTALNCYLSVVNIAPYSEEMTLKKLGESVDQNFSTESSKLERSLTVAIQDFILPQNRDEMKDSSYVADIRCELVGSNVPPYTTEAAGCQVYFPRPRNQYIFEGSYADKTSHLLAGKSGFGGSSTEVSGQINCDWPDSGPPSCTLSSNQSADETHIDPKTTAFEYYLLSRQVLLQRLQHNEEAGKFNPSSPLLTPVTCSVDFSNLANKDSQISICTLYH